MAVVTVIKLVNARLEVRGDDIPPQPFSSLASSCSRIQMFNGINQLNSEVFIKNIYTDFSFIQQLVIEYLSCAYRCIICYVILYVCMYIYET